MRINEKVGGRYITISLFLPFPISFNPIPCVRAVLRLCQSAIMTRRKSFSTSSQPSTSALSLSPWLCHFYSLCQAPPWTCVKESLYECWMCFYGPVFWVMYMFACSMDLHRARRQSFVDGMTFVPSEDNLHTSRHDKSPKAVGVAYSNSSSHAKPHWTRKIKSSTDDDLRSIRSSKSFRRTLKFHLRTIRQKQQSLNDVMRRSLLRRASKVPLIQAPLSFQGTGRHTMIPMKPSTSLPAASLSDSPPPPTSSPCTISPYCSKALPFDRRVSLSDSLLKSISMKRKIGSIVNSTPSAAMTSITNYKAISTNGVHKESTTPLTGPLLSSTTSPVPKPSTFYRRKATPEILLTE